MADIRVVRKDVVYRTDTYYFIREGKRSVGNGLFKQGHLWVFVDKPIKQEYARGWGLMVMEKCGISETTKSFELFPKGGKSEKFVAGVRLPLGIHAKANSQRIWLPDVQESLEKQLEFIVNQPVNQADRIEFLGGKQNELCEAQSKYLNNFEKPTKSIEVTALQMLKELEWHLVESSGRLLGQCPLCAEEGHDKSCNNLHVSRDGRFGCFYEGWNQVHTSKQIYRKLLKLTNRL